jgi:hypothetical protein
VSAILAGVGAEVALVDDFADLASRSASGSTAEQTAEHRTGQGAERNADRTTDSAHERTGFGTRQRTRCAECSACDTTSHTARALTNGTTLDVGGMANRTELIKRLRHGNLQIEKETETGSGVRPA